MGGAGVQTISVVVVDSLSNLEMKKMVYNGNDFSKTYVKLENNSLLTVIRNVSNGEINYGVREVFVVVDCFEKNLEIFANTDLAEGNILIVPTYKEQITNLNYNSAKYSNLIDTSREEFSTWIFKFEFKYEGYASYNVNFKFKANGYEYLEELAVNVEFKSASNMIEVKNVNDSSSNDSDTFNIYDSYVGTYGTRFIISTNTSDEFSKAILALKFSDDALNNFIVFDAVGNQKTADANGVYYFTSGENFYIRSITGSARVEPYIVFAQVSYTFENVEFSTEKTIYFNSINSPDDFVFKTEEDVELDYYNFDLNNSGKIVSGIKETELYIARNTLTLFLEGKIGGVSTGELADFVILNTSGILNVVKGENGEIVITALATGVGSFRVQLGNGVYKDFNFNVINSVSDINAFFPQENQNSNIFAVLENYENIGIIYDQYVLFKNLSKIPLILDYTGVLTGVIIDENENFAYQDGAIKAKREFEKQELIVKVSFNYIDENGEIAEKEIEIQKILLTSMTKIESFNISTNKGNNNFELYDFSSVGFYFNDLATAYIYLNVLPQSIASDVFTNVVWGTNVPNSSQNVDANTGIVTITNDVFTFKFYQTGENAGMGVIVCNVTNPNLYDENGNLTLGKVVISASFSVGEGEDIGTYYKTVQFNVKRATTVEVIDSSLTSIDLDPYDSQANLVVNSFPINSTNKKLIYVFIPSTPWLGEDAIILTKTNDGVNIKLNPLYNYGGKGILRIIAKDSYTSASTFKTYLDIPVNIADGTEDFPYIINNSMDVQKMIDTEFKHYYIVNGEIDSSNVGWESGEYVLTGTIIGKNNAKFVNYNINSVSFNDQDKEYYAGLFKEINGVIKNIAFENITFNIDLTGSTQKTNLYFGYIGAIAGKNRGTIENVSLVIGKQQAYKVVSSINVKESYKLNFGGMFGINEGTILTKITSNSINNKLVEFKTEVLIKDSTEESKITSHQIFVGGVAGQNLSGIIKREMENGIVEFNNGFATSIVDFNIETKNSDISTQGFGGIVGNNEYVGGGIVNNPGIYNVSAYGKIFANLSNNVGGIAGNNGLKIEGALSQVQVVGNENVGGAVGFNSGELSSIYVENIERGNRK